MSVFKGIWTNWFLFRKQPYVGHNLPYLFIFQGFESHHSGSFRAILDDPKPLPLWNVFHHCLNSKAPLIEIYGDARTSSHFKKVNRLADEQRIVYPLWFFWQRRKDLQVLLWQAVANRPLGLLLGWFPLKG